MSFHTTFRRKGSPRRASVHGWITDSPLCRVAPCSARLAATHPGVHSYHPPEWCRLRRNVPRRRSASRSSRRCCLGSKGLPLCGWFRGAGRGGSILTRAGRRRPSSSSGIWLEELTLPRSTVSSRTFAGSPSFSPRGFAALPTKGSPGTARASCVADRTQYGWHDPNVLGIFANVAVLLNRLQNQCYERRDRSHRGRRSSQLPFLVDHGQHCIV